MILNRELQKEILLFLRNRAPRFTSPKTINEHFGETAKDQIFYLAGHDLVALERARHDPKHGYGFASAVITSKGADFIEQDGGLSAILDKVTFKLDEEQFNDILALAVDQSTIPLDQKPALKKALETAGHSTITTLITKGIDSIATSAPDILKLLAKAI